MTIVGIGTDITDIRRIQTLITHNAQAFLKKIFTEKEQKIIALKNKDSNFIAKRWAGKEACIKALKGKISWLEIEIFNQPDGSPYMLLLPDHFRHITPFISLSDEFPYAQAMVMLEK